MGISVQNFMQLGGCADSLHPFILNRVSGLMQFLTADQSEAAAC
jgi:hypothetical protein